MKNYTSIIMVVFILLFVAATCDKEDDLQIVDCTENIFDDCICTQEYDPVCGCNNKTYGNECSAKCSGISTYTKGECK